MKALPIISLPIALTLIALMVPSASAQSTTNTIITVSPDSAAQGTTSLTVTFTLSATPPPPPINVPISSITLGSLSGTVSPHTNQYVVAAQFNIPASQPTGSDDVTITFGGSFVGFKAAGFAVTSAPLAANFTAFPTSGVAPLSVDFADASTGSVTNRLWNFGDGSTSTATNPVHTFCCAGSYNVSLAVNAATGSNTLYRADCVTVSPPPPNGAYGIVDTKQTNCYNDQTINPIAAPASGQPLFGQDGQIYGNQPMYTNNNDGTISDLNTGLMGCRRAALHRSPGLMRFPTPPTAVSAGMLIGGCLPSRNFIPSFNSPAPTALA